MKKYDLQNITFCVFARIDNEERADNLKAMVNFYRLYGKNVKFIISEDGLVPKVPDIINLTKNDVYTFNYNDTEWEKCEGYNKCIKLAKTNTLVFNDVDAIIHPSQLLEAHSKLEKEKKYGLIYPYNGLFLCTDKKLKDEFINSNYNYDILSKRIPSSVDNYNGSVTGHHERTYLAYEINKTYNNVLIGHVNSKGGCVMGRRDNIIKCNGYNPLFKGWGYEDDEFPTRISGFGFIVGRIPGAKKPCWHLHHFDGKGSKKEHQEFYEHNRQICTEVEAIIKNNKKELKNYITNWKL